MKCSACGARAGLHRNECPSLAAPEPRRGARDERLMPVVEIGPGRELGMDVATFEVIR